MASYKNNKKNNKNTANTANSFQSLGVEEVDDAPTQVAPIQVAQKKKVFVPAPVKVTLRAIMEEQERESAPETVPLQVENEEYANRDDEPDGFVQSGFKFSTVTMSAYNDKLGGAFIAAAKKCFPNPEGAKFNTPVKVKYDPKTKEYKITAYARTPEKAKEIIETLSEAVKLFLADKNTEVEVSRSNPESFRRFFNGRDAQRLFPYIFTLDEREEGVFIKLFRQGVSMQEFSEAELEFWRIYDFFNSLNNEEDEVNIMSHLREFSPAIDATVDGFKTKKHSSREGVSSYRPPTNYN